MRNFLLPCIIVLLLISPVFAQKKIPKHKTKFSFGLQASPDVYIYDFKRNQNYNFTYNSIFNYSAGGTFIYYPVKLLTLRATVLYSKKGYNLDYNYNFQTVDSLGLPEKVNLDISYLDVPLQLNINLIHKDMFQLYISGGIVPGFLISTVSETFLLNKSKISDPAVTKNFNEFIAGTVYSIGMKVNISEAIGLGLEPYYRYYLNKIDKETMGKNPISFGGKFAILFNIHHKHHSGSTHQD